MPVLDTMTRRAGVSHEIILREEEIFDVSLATERAGASEPASGPPTKIGGWCVFACLAGPAASENNTYFAPGAGSDQAGAQAHSEKSNRQPRRRRCAAQAERRPVVPGHDICAPAHNVADHRPHR
jgi:hypothetical protein